MTLETKQHSELIADNHTYNGEMTKKDVNTLVQAGIIPRGTPLEQIQVFAKICRERGLSPFSKEIYLVGYAGKYSCITGIDGYRKIACRSGEYAGSDEVVFNKRSDGSYDTASELMIKKELPVSATATVYRIVGGHRVAFTHTVLFSEFSSGQQKWKSMPFQMIAKVAEAFALRQGFADRLSGLSIPEEKVAYEDRQSESMSDADSAKAEEIRSDAATMIANASDLVALARIYRDNPLFQSDDKIIEMLNDRKNELLEELEESLSGISDKVHLEKFWKENKELQQLKEVKALVAKRLKELS